jgi:hypothetical protein
MRRRGYLEMGCTVPVCRRLIKASVIPTFAGIYHQHRFNRSALSLPICTGICLFKVRCHVPSLHPRSLVLQPASRRSMCTSLHS